MKKAMIGAILLMGAVAHAQSTGPYAGKVGINTYTPSATLNVKSKENTASTKAFEVENSDGTKMVTVRNNNRVGIGTDNPSARFHFNAVYNGNRLATDNDMILTYYENGSTELIDPIGVYIKRYGGTPTAPENLRKGTLVSDIFAQGYYNSTDNPISRISTYYNGDGTTALGSLNLSVVGGLTDLVINRGEGDTFTKVGIGTGTPTEKLDVEGKIRATSLKGTGDRPVVADENGVLKIGTAAASETISSTTSMPCNEANRGKMNFVKDVTLSNGDKADAFGICMKGSDAKFYWRYIYGAGGLDNGLDAFGTGLN